MSCSRARRTKDIPQEQIDDIEIQGNGSRDLLVRVHPSEDELSIDKDISGEQQCTHARVRQLDPAVMWEEHGNETEKDQEPECAVEITVPTAKVVFCLERKEGEAGE